MVSITAGTNQNEYCSSEVIEGFGEYRLFVPYPHYNPRVKGKRAF
jgi:hypothetical protein